MPITNNDLKNLQKSLFSEISKFLEDHVINKLFKLEKDIDEMKNDIEQMDRKLDKSIERADRHGITLEKHEERITSLEQL